MNWGPGSAVSNLHPWTRTVKEKIIQFFSRYSAWRWAWMVSLFCFFGNLILGLRDDKLEDRSALVYTPPVIPAGKNAFESLRKNPDFHNLNQDYDNVSKFTNQIKQAFIHQHAEAYKVMHDIIASDQVILVDAYRFQNPRIFDLIRLEAELLCLQEKSDQALRLMLNLQKYLTRLIRCDHNRSCYNYTEEGCKNARFMARILSRATDQILIREVITAHHRDEDWRQLHRQNILCQNAEFEKSLTSALKGDYCCPYFGDIPSHLTYCNGLFLKKNRTLNAQREQALILLHFSQIPSAVEHQKEYVNYLSQFTDSLARYLLNSLRRLNWNGAQACTDWYCSLAMLNAFQARTMDMEVEIMAALRLHELDKGKLPDNLESLVPDYLHEVHLNPINLNPFLYSAQHRQVYGLDGRVIGLSLGLNLRLDWDQFPSTPKPSTKPAPSTTPQKSSP